MYQNFAQGMKNDFEDTQFVSNVFQKEFQYAFSLQILDVKITCKRRPQAYFIYVLRFKAGLLPDTT